MFSTPAVLFSSKKISCFMLFVAGAVGAIGFEPYKQPLLLILALAALIRFLYGVNLKRGILFGFSFGLGHFLAAYAWLITSMTEYGNIPLIVAIPVYVVVCAEVAIYPAIFGLLVSLLVKKSWQMLLFVPALWVVMEWLRSIMFCFAWNLSGYAWSGWIELIQVADFGGVYILSWMIALPATVIASALIGSRCNRSVMLGFGSVLLVFSAAVSYGQWRIKQISQANHDRTIPIAMIQGNIPQAMKWDPRFRNEISKVYKDLTLTQKGRATLAIWPESALPFQIQHDVEGRNQLAALVQQAGLSILTGADMSLLNASNREEHFNSMLLLQHADPKLMDLTKHYDKHHLVPFGEYLPFREWMPEWVADLKIPVGVTDVTHGKGEKLINWQGILLGSMICYEAIFPDEVRRIARAGAQILINVSNDAWFGEAAKPQHLAMARMRTIENRLPMVRVSNTGISASYDVMGRELARIESNQRGAVTVDISPRHAASFYVAHGPVFVWFCLFIICAGSLQMGLLRLRSGS